MCWGTKWHSWVSATGWSHGILLVGQMTESQPLLIWMACAGCPCRGQDRHIEVEGYESHMDLCWMWLWKCCYSLAHYYDLQWSCFVFKLGIYSVGVKTRLRWTQLWYFSSFLNTHHIYVCVCFLGVVYQNDDPTRVHNGGVRLCIWIFIFNSICSVRKKKFVVMAGFLLLCKYVLLIQLMKWAPSSG